MSRGQGSVPEVQPAGTAFATTHWSVVLRAAEVDSSDGALALESLCRAYWFPLYTYVRKRGYELQDAQDLTQEFFSRLLSRNYLGTANRSKGRFRSFLLTSLKNFLANEWDRSHAARRGGQCSFLSWDQLPEESPFRGVPLVTNPSDDTAYDQQWVLTLLDKVFARLREECAAAGKGALFEKLQVYLSGERSQTGETSYACVGKELGLSVGAVQVAVHRLRKRYGELLREEIAQTVSRPDEIDDEIRYLFSALHH